MARRLGPPAHLVDLLPRGSGALAGLASAQQVGGRGGDLLVGRSAPLGLDQQLRTDLESMPGVLSVPVFVTTVTGPRRLLVAAKVEFRDDFTTVDLERVADEVEQRMLATFPGIDHVFLDPTPAR